MPACNRCGREVSFRRIDGAVKPLDPDTGERHRCGRDVYDLPQDKRLNIFNPKASKYDKKQGRTDR
jgi:hypothetical protein